ncbi:hypothetical protein T492DRAFT_906247 [Pavlovales sp. CCMP2436]|nr:hypothetical protein T492DRAFT_906247 [Pavlovales sp. CCMP2436]
MPLSNSRKEELTMPRKEDDSGHVRMIAAGVTPSEVEKVDEEGFPDVLADGWGLYLRRSIGTLLFEEKLNILMLVCATTPFALMSKRMGWGDGLTFFFALVSIAPFAERLSFVTEQLAMYTNDTLGGLLNATFGNVTELIVSVFALRAGMYHIVKVNLLGSVLSNLLLVAVLRGLAIGLDVHAT